MRTGILEEVENRIFNNIYIPPDRTFLIEIFAALKAGQAMHDSLISHGDYCSYGVEDWENAIA
jgi:hypothetical protein